MDHIGDTLITKFNVHQPIVKILTNVEAVNYTSDLMNVNTLDKKSSAGLPWKTMKGVNGKTPMLKFDEKTQVWRIDQEDALGLALLAAIDALIAACRNGLKTMVIFDAALKDEVLPLKKVDDVRTRIILGAPVEATIVHRKYLASLGAAICSLHNEIPVKVGINPYNEWDTLYKHA
jgi:hypothetical protein